MENAADALKMAAWVLIFVTALSIIMNAFGQARTTVDVILESTDREYITTYIPKSGKTKRTVGFESIIPSIYRSFRENYKVVFDGYTLYRVYKDGRYSSINYLDLNINGYTESVQEQFLLRILYGINNSRFQSTTAQKYTEDHFRNIKFEGTGLYDKIKLKTFEESIGIYVPDEATTGATDTPESSKTEKRVITYKQI